MNRTFKILCLFVLFLSLEAKAQKIGGLYPVNNTIDKLRYEGKVNIIKRRDGNLKVEFKFRYRYEGMPRGIVFLSPVLNKKNTYETYEEKYSPFRIVAKNDNVFLMYTMSKYRYIRDTIIFAKSKKILRTTMRALKGKSRRKSYDKKKKVDPIALKFIARNPVSEFHEKYAGKIVFFNERPVIGKEDPSKMKKSFKVGEAIWAVAYLPTSIKYSNGAYNGLCDNLRTTDKITGKQVIRSFLSFQIDQVDKDLSASEKKVSWNFVGIIPDGPQNESNYFIFQILPGFKDKYVSKRSGEIASRFVKKLGEYKHILRFRLDGRGDEGSIFVGELEYDLSTGKKQLTEFAKKIKSLSLDARELPKPVIKDANLENEMVKQANLFANGRGWRLKCVKAIIASNWQVLTKKNGSIMGKYIQGYCVFKDPNQKNCMYVNLGFIKEYQGGGEYSNSIRQYDSGSRYEISCKKAK